MTREQMKSHFIVHTNGQDEWIKVDKRTYDKAIDMFCDAHEAEIEELRSTINRFVEEAAMHSNALDRDKEAYEAELKAKDARITELEAKLEPKTCDGCEYEGDKVGGFCYASHTTCSREPTSDHFTPYKFFRNGE